MNEHKLRNGRLKERMNPSANEGMNAQALWPQPQSESWASAWVRGRSLRTGQMTASRATPSEMPNGETWLTFRGHSSSGILLA